MSLGDSHLQTFRVVATDFSNKVYLLRSIKEAFQLQDVFLLFKERFLMPDLMEMNQSLGDIQDHGSTVTAELSRTVGVCFNFIWIFLPQHVSPVTPRRG